MPVFASNTVLTSEQAPSYLALGDSYTIGEGVLPAQRWPAQLAKQLHRAGMAIGTPQIIAKTGWTTEELLTAMREAGPEGGRKLITLLIGVNNQYRGQSLERYREEFTELLQQAIALADHQSQRVVVVSIPDYGLTPFIADKPDRDPKQIARELDAFNRAAREITKQHQARWVNITPVSRRRGREKSMLAQDGLHPSGPMYQLWVEEILPYAKQAVSDAW